MFFMISLALLKGIGTFLKDLLKKDKILYVIGYFGTMGGTLYYSLINPSYVYVLVLAAL